MNKEGLYKILVTSVYQCNGFQQIDTHSTCKVTLSFQISPCATNAQEWQRKREGGEDQEQTFYLKFTSKWYGPVKFNVSKYISNLSRCRDQSPSTDSLTWRWSNIHFNSQIKNVDSPSIKTFTFCLPETFLPVEKPSQLSSESSSTSQVYFYPTMCPNDKPWRSAGVWVSPNHKHQHCWVQFRNWFLRLCGLRRPILFLLDTSKYYNLIFTHLSKYIFVLWRFGSDFVVHTSWAKVSVLVITAVVLCPACPNPQSPPTHSFVADPSALQVPRPAECPTPYEDPCSATHCYFPPASKPLTTTKILFKCHFLCFGISRQQ